ncbi:hypothetical protein, conserved [Trypanosoma brucei gambiense DAL972]|uniref:Nuclear segregation protein n=1 Tax=Trypanosoma brucei gambiense (strain MHOM/CI/86/DAL972) TaxID=679716 RepID=C9ZZZ2_TRYB9|nr:hypothetical protein, conserved [Trypanosoma brucei gambiense DAL972]CBH16550.1 hypothetical protein, conserved [Trypanosoma brucei gambiense DAL972]|eukprot:XP_011778814.1 hypothetical protein, conserved [Trypanosoma brucei gambiense DAL972]
MSKTETAPEAAPAPTERRPQPRWMTAPGAPPRPDVMEHRTKMKALSQEKGALIAQIKELRASLGPKSEPDKERDEIRQRLKELDDKRKAEQEMRSKKSEEIIEVRKKHDEYVKKLRSLTDDLGGFKSVEEFDEAIEYMTKKMETSGGGLAAEKRIMRQIGQLEDAKRYLQELQPVSEAIAEAKHCEATLQREIQEINERIRGLNEEYKGQRSTKMEKDDKMRSAGANRQEVFKKCDEISAKITSITKEMNALSEDFQKAMEVWKSWCDEARAKHMAKMEEVRKERHRRFLERKNAPKLAEKRERALRRMNPYEVEIAACDTLLQYLRDQKIMVQRENEERARREAAANFDPAEFAPEGAVVLNDGMSHQNGGDSKKQKQQANKAKRDSAPKPRVIKHSEEKLELFKLVDEQPPRFLEDIGGIMENIRAKLKEYSSHIKTGEPELSSDDEEDEEKKEQEGEEEAAATEDETNEGEGEDFA